MNPHFDFSQIGRRFTAHSGIVELMDDLGRAVTEDPKMRMLGGGAPAPVPELLAMARARMNELLGEGDAFERLMVSYDPPRGNPRFIAAMAELLKRTFGWDVGPQNIAVTSGGQSAFFYLFNMLAGGYQNGQHRKILLPLAPEYIGYADQGIDPDLFVACQPGLDWPEGRERRVFKYRIDFNAVEEALQHRDIGAIVASRPTNPSGNVLTDDEVRHLSELAARHGIPLILDNAYGAPFPGVIFRSVQPHWAPHVILALSLSKLGLPGTRTGIVVAPAPIATAIGSFTAIVGLSNNTLGQRLVLPWVEDGRILEIGPKILRPFYEDKSRSASAWAREAFEAAGVEWAMHACEGTFFLWLWFPDLRVRSRQLYERLKARKVLVVPGEYFFFGLKEEWPHRHECIRINVSGPADAVRQGLRIIAEEAAKAGR